ncbi:hypothetical protein M5689_021873 [Euphorbia peplus]|nr:hypothetical protein M5689_021873 [Euphorbia peplus]
MCTGHLLHKNKARFSQAKLVSNLDRMRPNADVRSVDFIRKRPTVVCIGRLSATGERFFRLYMQYDLLRGSHIFRKGNDQVAVCLVLEL